MKKISIVLMLIAMGGFSCENDPQDDFYEVFDNGQPLVGTWLNVESGGSPGNGYITSPVPTVPPKVLRLSSDGKITSNLDDFQQYHFYRVLDVADTDGPVLAFFVEDPEVTNPDIATAGRSYNIIWEERKLKLYYRWCIEGCHLGFLKLSENDGG